MGDQPGAGRPQSFKIKSNSRQRRSAKPYSRPSDRKKGVLESVKDFFSPSWLLDFWKGKTEEVDEENDGVDSENDREEPVDINRDVPEPSGVFERAGSSGSYTVYAPRLDSSKRTEVLGNGGIVASAQRASQTSQKSGLAALLAIRSREPMNRQALETTSTTFTRVSNSSRTNEYSTHTTTRQEMVETQIQSESLPQERSKTPPLLTPLQESSPILNTMEDQPTPSLFGTSLGPGSSSTPVETQTGATPKPSVLSSGRLSRPQHTSVFRTKPEFSVSAFGSPLPPRPSSQSRRYSSPYYSGNTTFGGASSQDNKAGKRARISSPGSAECVQPVKRQVRPTPLAGTSGSGVASQTAKRILETLEKMSSPLVDAKKIPPSPPSSSPLSFTQTRQRKAQQQSYGKPVGSPRKLQAQFSGPPVQSLSVPRRAALSRLKTTKDTTPSTFTSRVSSTPLATTTTTTTTGLSSTLTSKSFVPAPLPVSLSPMESSKSDTSGGGGGGGKIRAAKTSSTHYKSQAIEEEEEVVNPLPQITSAVPLAIPTGAQLPSFSFPTSLPSKTSPQTTTSITQKTFSTLKGKSPDMSSNNYKFSVPHPKSSSGNTSSSRMLSVKKIEYSFSNPAPVSNSETTTDQPSGSPSLFDKFKPAEGAWECSTCMISNKADASTCAACSTPKPAQKHPTLPSNNDLFKKFQPPSHSWSCDTCMLTNKEKDEKCIACETPKPSSKQPEKPKTNLLPIKTKDTGTLLKQFAPPSDSWECPTCMVPNKAQDSKCVACNEPKPGAKPSTSSDNLLLKQFAPVEGSWSCDTCMIMNKSSTDKCIACETPKPGTSASGTSSFSATAGFKVSTSEKKFQNSPFKFGTSDNSNTDDASSKTVTFGSSSSSTSGSNPFKLGSTSTTTSPFVFGGAVASSASSSSDKKFTFGSSSSSTTSAPIQFGSTSTTESSKNTIKFGSSESTSQAKTTFQFGAKEPESSGAAPAFKFGSSDSSTDKDKQPSFQFGSSAKTESTKPAPFVFGVNSSPAKTSGITKAAETNGPPKKSTQESPKVSSIAQAAAAGFLKIPSSVDVVDLTADNNSNSEPAKPQQTDGAPPNVNLFAGKGLPSASTMFEATTAPKTDQPTTTTLPSLQFAFGTTTAVNKPFDEPAKPTSAFAFTPSNTATGVLKFGQMTAPETTPVTFPKFGETSALTAAATVATASTPASGFQFGSAFGAADKPASTTASLAAPQISFAAQAAQSNPLGGLSGTAKNTGLSITPFVFKGAGDVDSLAGNSTAPGSGFVFKGTGDGNKLAGNSTTPSTGFGFGSAGSAATTGFTFGAGPTNPSKTSSDSNPAPFVFSGQGDTSKTGFAFGAPNQPFAFGSSSTATTTTIPPSSLVNDESMDADGNNNNNQSTVPAFGSTVAPGAAAATPFNFASAAPANTGFNFSSNIQPAGSFKFGDSSGNTSNNPPMFGSSSTPAFGSSTGTSIQPGTASSGFNFGSTTTNTSQPGGFSVGTRSSNTFTAGSGGVAQKRVIKRGIRRSKR